MSRINLFNYAIFFICLSNCHLLFASPKVCVDQDEYERILKEEREKAVAKFKGELDQKSKEKEAEEEKIAAEKKAAESAAKAVMDAVEERAKIFISTINQSGTDFYVEARVNAFDLPGRDLRVLGYSEAKSQKTMAALFSPPNTKFDVESIKIYYASNIKFQLGDCKIIPVSSDVKMNELDKFDIKPSKSVEIVIRVPSGEQYPVCELYYDRL